ncbi:MAG: hypothetical protein NXI04_10880 [Planctomycetaceae bacterium]|nr:hypothetical protein [Planctomycetaceae bacterium]
MSPSSSRSFVFRFSLLAVCAVSFLSAASAQSNDTIPRALQKQIPAIIDYLNEHDCRTVGVLKFRIKKGNDKLSDSVGPLNSLIADRLEVGLILANPFDEQRQLNIIKDASTQVGRIGDATHLTQAGRNAFFDKSFDLSWGKQRSKADAFLTGIVQVHPDGRNVSIGVLAFRRGADGLQRACDVVQAKLDASTLGELGESFVLRGAFDGGTFDGSSSDDRDPETVHKEQTKQREKREQTAVEEAVKVKTKDSRFPLNDSAAPLKLEILYDGQPVAIETRDGRAFVQEPQQGQKVELAIVRSSNTSGRLGVVLKVNGENTLYRQTVSDLECAKWILSPEHVRTVVRGYQIDGTNEMESFAVLSQEASAQRAMDYGRHVGQIQVTVFKEEDLKLADDLPPVIPDEDEEDLVAMLRGIQPRKTPQNLSALKHQLRLAGKEEPETRGLIVQDKVAKNEIEIVSFTPDPTPVMSATITYYQAD